MSSRTSNNTDAASAGFYGKFRGTVTNNTDPLNIGRIQAIVPDVGSLMEGSWAMPCVPIAGPNTGFFAVPMVGTGVWIEFERGDPDKPIWTGCYWGLTAELPVLSRIVPPAVPGFTLQTPLGTGVVISDMKGPTGGILLQTATGAMISINETGILSATARARSSR